MADGAMIKPEIKGAMCLHCAVHPSDGQPCEPRQDIVGVDQFNVLEAIKTEDALVITVQLVLPLDKVLGMVAGGDPGAYS